MPALRPEAVKVACPEFRTNAAEGPPSTENDTVPVGMPVAGANSVTVAVNVTDWPATDGFELDVTLVVVEALTVCEKGGAGTGEIVRVAAVGGLRSSASP